MLEYFKRLSGYYGGTVTFLLALKKGLDLDNKIGWGWPLLGCLALLPLIAIFAWLEKKPRAQFKFWNREETNGSFILALQDALSRVHLAAPEDEAIALQANHLVRDVLDKRCISYDAYRTWRQKNPAIFRAVVNLDNELVGFFDVMPLDEKTTAELIAGTREEHSIRLENLLPKEENDKAKSIYIATVMANPSQTAFGYEIAKDVTLIKLVEYLQTAYAPIEKRTLLAFGQSEQGQISLRRSGFTEVLPASRGRQGDPLFLLKPEAIRTSFARFEQFNQRLKNR